MDYCVKTCDGVVNLADILCDVKKELLAAFDNKIIQLKLYGSYARGDFTDESDTDIFLLYSEKDVECIENLDDKLTDISL